MEHPVYDWLFQMSENEVIEPSALVSTVNNQRLQVLTRSTPTECAHLGMFFQSPTAVSLGGLYPYVDKHESESWATCKPKTNLNFLNRK